MGGNEGGFGGAGGKGVDLVRKYCARMARGRILSAYFVHMSLMGVYEGEGGPEGYLGAQRSDTDESGPPSTWRDERHDFRNQPYNCFYHGFVGINDDGSTCTAEAHRYFPEVLMVVKDGEIVQDGEKEDGTPIYKVQLSMGAALDPAPEASDGASAQVTLRVEFNGDREPWVETAVVGPESILLEYEELLPVTTTLEFTWTLDREVFDPADDLIGYAPCLYFDREVAYTMLAKGYFEEEVSCTAGGGHPF